MNRYDYRIAQGSINRGEAGVIRGEHPALTTLDQSIEKAYDGVIQSNTLNLFHLIGLLRYEANKMEKEYIRRMEHSPEDVSEIDEQEAFTERRKP